MVRRVNSIHARAAIVFHQMAKAASYAPSEDERERFFNKKDNPYYTLLDEIYGEDYALAKLVDNADFIVHAHGPAAKNDSPELRAVNWLCNGVDKQLRMLAKTALSLYDTQAQSTIKKINLQLTGFAPGSLFAGFRVADPQELSDNHIIDGLDSSEIDLIRLSITQMTQLPKFVGDDHISSELSEYIVDPAIRDASIVTAFQLAPSGRMGIHSIEISTKNTRPETLGQRERVVLKDAIKSPKMIKSFKGGFTGVVRGVDLDSKRFHLRGVPDIGSIRCVMHDLNDKSMRNLLDKTVSIKGCYEIDQNNRPRLMVVDSVEVIPEPVQTELSGL